MDYLFQNKKKNILAACFTLFYLVMTVIVFGASGVGRMAIPVALLILLVTANKNYRIKKWILPTCLGIGLISSIRTLIANIGNFKNAIEIYSSPQYSLLIVCALLTTISGAAMFVGALFGFKRLFRYGALAVSVISFVTLVLDFISLGGFEYIKSVPNGYTAVNFGALILSLSHVLFYMGIFVLANNKEKE